MALEGTERQGGRQWRSISRKRRGKKEIGEMGRRVMQKLVVTVRPETEDVRV